MRNDYSSRIYSVGHWKVMEDSLPPELLEEYKQAFQILDRKNIGMISLRDLSTVTCSIGIQLTEAELRLYVTQITGSSMEGCDAVTCVIDFKNFLFLMAVILTECISGEEVLRIFKEFDKDGDGFISPHELKALLSRYGHEATDDEVKAMMEEADKDGDGMVSLHEFINVMSTSNLMQTRILQNLLPEDEPSSTHSDLTVKSRPKTIPEDDESSCSTYEDSCNFTDDDKSLMFDPKNRRRRKSVVDWLKIKSRDYAKNGQQGFSNSNNNSNNNNTNNESKNVMSSMQGKRRKSITKRFSITIDMMKKQVSRSKLRMIPDEN